MMKDEAGFTLVETLVAAVILFSVLTSAFLAFQAAITSSARAESRLHLLAVVPRVRAEVTQQMRGSNVASGRGVMGGVAYEWRAALSTRGAALNIDNLGSSTGLAPQAREFRLWRVMVSLELSGSRREFIFTELTWSG
jgi:type II secretory pathway pseudopilin PulG